MERKSFIPRDKPKSWVVFVLSALLCLAFGLCTFAAAAYDLTIVKVIFIAGFVACWTVAAVAGITCGIGMAIGRYADLQERPWQDQVW